MSQEIVKFYQTNKIYLFPIIVGISSLILIIFIIYPQAEKLLSNQKVEGDIFNKSQFLATKVNALEQYDIADLKNKVESVISFYPTEKEVISVIGLLQNTISQLGYITTSMTLVGGAGVSGNSQPQSYSINIELAGPPQLLPSLLANIENSQRLMRVSSVEVTNGNDAKVAEVALVVEIFFSSPPSDLGSVDSPLPQLSQKDEEIIQKLTTIVPSQSLFQDSISGARGKINPFE